MGNRVRIIDKEGKVKFVSSHIAKNEKLLASYGYEVQHLPTDEDQEGKKPDEDQEGKKPETPVEKGKKQKEGKGDGVKGTN